MKILSLSLYLLFQFSTIAEAKGNPFFRVLPESESLLSFGQASSQELSANSIKALIWNIKKSQLDGWREEFSQFSSQQDIFLLQEAYRNQVFDQTLANVAAQWNLGISFLYQRYGAAPTGSLVGGTPEPRLAYVKHSPDTEPFTNTPKSITFATYPIANSNQELLVVSVHAINFETTGAFKRQMDQAYEEMKSHSGPILFAGDFNTWNNSRLSYLRKISSNLELQEAELKNGSSRTKFNGFYLDHAFTRGLQVKSAEVISESVGSDHRPILLELSVL